ncbi:MAG TPA: N-acetylglucosamine-6-phosphate deacetylase [Acetobacteraceae bacterium]|nr:N-acetylglucosamine-6-phosphate deacetylase [Acetobacteraceae bacterium]
MSLHALIAPRLFTGEEMLPARAVLIEDGRILAVIAPADLPPDVPAERLPPDTLLVPGFIDLQVNGGGGVLFNDRMDAASLATIARAHRRFGTTGMLPTLITDTPEHLEAALNAAAAAMAAQVPGILGLHVEGPFLNPARKGIHPPACIRAPTEADLTLLTRPFPGRLLVTLAPEMVPEPAIRRLVQAGVIVFAGHSDATAAQLQAGMAAGISGVTHLFNAMSHFGSREPGMVGTTLATPDLFAGIIADGIHLHPLSLAAAFAAKGARRLLLVTDAMPSVGSDRPGFTLQSREIRLADGRLTDEAGTLAGAHLDMASAVRNAVRMAGIDLADALHMASLTPAAAIGLDDRLGRIAAGFRADLVALDAGLGVIRIWSAER